MSGWVWTLEAVRRDPIPTSNPTLPSALLRRQYPIPCVCCLDPCLHFRPWGALAYFTFPGLRLRVILFLQRIYLSISPLWCLLGCLDACSPSVLEQRCSLCAWRTPVVACGSPLCVPSVLAAYLPRHWPRSFAYL